MKETKQIKIAFIGGGSQNWAPTIIRDIIFKKGMEKVGIEFALLDIDKGRVEAISRLFEIKLAEWKVDWVKVSPTTDSRKALSGADYVIIAISTGRLPAMKHDLEIPEKYGIYHTVGDTAGPGGWARSLRNIPVFSAYAKQIKELAPDAFVLNYTNPMGTLTKVLADEVGESKVVGLCHGLFECYDILKIVFDLKSEEDIKFRFGGLNHFFWLLDISIKGKDGYALIKDRLQGRNFAELVKESHVDAMGWSSEKWFTGELFENYGYLPYFGDRHTCEFFNCTMTNKDIMERFKLVRTSIAEREAMYVDAEKRITSWTQGKKADWGHLTKKPSRETAADIIKALVFGEGFTDVMNLVNKGQIENLPKGAVVETMGYVDGRNFVPLTVGLLPEQLKVLSLPHAEVQIRTVEAGLSGNLDSALMALLADPICAHLSASDVKKMGMELLNANKKYLPQFFKD